MQSVGIKNTKPEMAVRRILRSLGYGYRLHRKDLPGTPDIAMIGRRKVIFVHGCFWHWHGCAKGRLPKSGEDYWRPKLERNVCRDRAKIQRLESLGWHVLVVWACELGDPEALAQRLQEFVGGYKNSIDIKREVR